ncbi:SPASM domain-containing protein [Candidatus Woesearchaeota archaeon]|nr:SPASM domain-containing protein [Candidatus Woesearchaeota archaeon]
MEANIDYVAIKPEINYRDPKNQLNFNTIEKINEYVKKNGAKIKNNFQTEVFYNSFFTDKLFESTELNSPCTSHGWVANVDWQGNLSFCVEFAMDKKYIIGNLVTDSFDDIWFGERRKELHQKINSNISLCPQVCRNRVKNHLIDILDTPYSDEDINGIMTKIKKYKENRNEPNHINFL